MLTRGRGVMSPTPHHNSPETRQTRQRPSAAPDPFRCPGGHRSHHRYRRGRGQRAPRGQRGLQQRSGPGPDHLGAEHLDHNHVAIQHHAHLVGLGCIFGIDIAHHHDDDDHLATDDHDDPSGRHLGRHVAMSPSAVASAQPRSTASFDQATRPLRHNGEDFTGGGWPRGRTAVNSTYLWYATRASGIVTLILLTLDHGARAGRPPTEPGPATGLASPSRRSIAASR